MPSLVFTGCATITHHGDAILTDNPNIVLAVVDPLTFPKTSVGKTGVYSCRVLDLPQEIYPDSFLLEIPAGEDSRWLHDQPWRHCVIRASLVTLGGKPFFEKTIAFAKDWNGNSQPGSDSQHRKISLAFTDYRFDTAASSLPKHLSYILHIEVLRPSLRNSDYLEVWAVTVLPHTKRLLQSND